MINKTDLAPMVGADLGVMEADTRRMRGERPFVMANLRGGVGTAEVDRLHRVARAVSRWRAADARPSPLRQGGRLGVIT